MTFRTKEERRRDVHALAAGSLFVLAIFVATAVPWALGMLASGVVTLPAVLYPLLFAALTVAGVLEARAWRRRPANAS